MDEAHNSGIMKYLINEKDAEKFFHSSGYAREAYHGNIGSQMHPADTFDARQELENNRQFIRGYKDAKVINDVRMSRAAGDAQRSQQISADSAARVASASQKRGGLGESVNGLRRGDRSGFGANRGGFGDKSENGGSPSSGREGGAQPSGRGMGQSASGPATPPARRVSGISR